MPKSVPEPCRLPSGRTVPLGIAADPRRPWDWIQHAGHYIVQREKRGDASALESYRDPYNRNIVLLDTAADAAALTKALNARVSQRLVSSERRV